MLFGTSGIRGIYGKDITESLGEKIAYLFADTDEIVIAKDTRASGKSLEEACIKGITGRGKKPILLGIAPTPTLALATVEKKVNGIMITASHNPSEYNGFKLFKDGKELTRKEEALFEKKFNAPLPPPKPMFVRYAPEIYTNAIESHKIMIKKLLDTNSISSKKPTVVVDCNGAGAVITPYLLQELGCRAISVNAELEGFNRQSEPNGANLTRTSEIVRATKADLGVAHDGDADRCVIIDETGTVLPLDTQLALMIEYELKRATAKNKLIISTVEASLLIRELCNKNNARLHITPVSSVYVSENLEKQHASFGGEPCGEYVFSRATHHAPDGVLAAALFVELFCKKGKLSALASQYKSFDMIREKFVSKNKYEAVRAITKRITIPGARNEEDGLRIDEDDGWFLIRASGTEPYIRLTMEYKDKKKLEKRREDLSSIIKNSIL